MTSFKPPDWVEINGNPQAIASPAPKPKPSYSEGITLICAEEYKETNSDWLSPE